MRKLVEKFPGGYEAWLNAKHFAQNKQVDISSPPPETPPRFDFHDMAPQKVHSQVEAEV
jgi:hypothetical protein